ncbi:polysaccharide deacetylase family protein [Cohnella soli]|uniref:Polysaccharide deacetylase family protein n=1 Tax=Cohnella soli TaxID=425005 RepID=A0ABW0HS89_9BACL
MRGTRLSRRRAWRRITGLMLLATVVFAAFGAWELKHGNWISTSYADTETPVATGVTGSPDGDGTTIVNPGSGEEPGPDEFESPPPESPDPAEKPPTKPEKPPATQTPLPGNNVRPVSPGKDQFPNRKLVALTFDDGPDGKYTGEILDILKEKHVKATFFLVGTQVAKYPGVAKRIVTEGHDIGNHSWSHADLTKLSAQALQDQLNKTQAAIFKATGVTSDLMRTPYGAYNDSVLNEIHKQEMTHVFWTVDTKDWAGTSVANMYKNVMSHTHKGGIILMHSFGGRKHAIDHTVALLPAIIKDLQAKGYEFVTVNELIASGQASSSAVK